jgi:hypothetical protein
MFSIFNINNFKNMHRFQQPPLTINIPVDDTVKGGSAPEVSTVAPETPEHKIQVIYDDLVKIGYIEEDLSIQSEVPVIEIPVSEESEVPVSEDPVSEESEESVSEDPAMLEPTPEAPYGYTASGRIRKRPLKSMLS